MVCLDTKNVLHIAYFKDSSYWSMCQIDNWTTEGESDPFDNMNHDRDVFSTFQDVLGSSGIKINILVGAAASDIFYIAMDDTPHLLLSDSISGDFTEYDIDQNGQKELMAYDNYMYIKTSEDIDKATYQISGDVKQVIFDEASGLFRVFFSNNIEKTYQYDKSKKILTLYK